MARPLSSDSYRGNVNGGHPAGRNGRDSSHQGGSNVLVELEDLRAENNQLRQLCADLEQALQEATAQAPDVTAYEERMLEYDTLLEEKSDTIRQLYQQIQDIRTAAEEAACLPAPRRSGPLPAEDELISLSEELEREKRQLQEDEASLMEQMRQMEMTMARERAEMARQRNDLQRLYGEIRHELERLERNGALQSKMEDLKTRLQDAATRRGAAPASANAPASSANLPTVQPGQQPAPVSTPAACGSLMGRLFGGNK